MASMTLAMLQAEIENRTAALDKFGEAYKTWGEARQVIQGVLDLCEAMGGPDEVLSAIEWKEAEEE